MNRIYSRKSPFARAAGLVLGVFLCISPVGYIAAQPSHSCYAPDIPEEFEDDQEREQFVAEAREFNECMKEFFDEQAALSREHAEAANAAKDELEAFAAEFEAAVEE